MPPRVPMGAPGGADHLRAAVLDLVGGRGGAGVAVADGQAADLAGGAQVALHQLRREVLHVGDVVEAGADRVGRQVGADVDVEAEQVAHRGGVLGAVQALERTPAGTRRRARRLCPSRVSSASTIAGDRRGVRARRRRRGGIMPARSLRIIFSVSSPFSTCLRGVEVRQRQAAGLAAIAMAGGAVAADEGVLRRRRSAVSGACEARATLPALRAAVRGAAAAVGRGTGDRKAR